MSRPSAELLERLREDKRRLHSAARALSLPEKVRRVIELQHIVLPQIALRRPLRNYEFVWDGSLGVSAQPLAEDRSKETFIHEEVGGPQSRQDLPDVDKSSLGAGA
jgi:hypothetical protein